MIRRKIRERGATTPSSTRSESATQNKARQEAANPFEEEEEAAAAAAAPIVDEELLIAETRMLLPTILPQPPFPSRPTQLANRLIEEINLLNRKAVEIEDSGAAVAEAAAALIAEIRAPKVAVPLTATAKMDKATQVIEEAAPTTPTEGAASTQQTALPVQVCQTGHVPAVVQLRNGTRLISVAHS